MKEKACRQCKDVQKKDRERERERVKNHNSNER
jgi:RNA polymerase subunit RPABC4/transcription elongation factor Spt4